MEFSQSSKYCFFKGFLIIFNRNVQQTPLPNRVRENEGGRSCSPCPAVGQDGSRKAQVENVTAGTAISLPWMIRHSQRRQASGSKNRVSIKPMRTEYKLARRRVVRIQVWLLQQKNFPLTRWKSNFLAKKPRQVTWNRIPRNRDPASFQSVALPSSTRLPSHSPRFPYAQSRRMRGRKGDPLFQGCNREVTGICLIHTLLTRMWSHCHIKCKGVWEMQSLEEPLQPNWEPH